jgi:4'-phosphopantetheinyl transferase
MATVTAYYTVFENVDTPINEKYIHALPPNLAKEILQYKKQDDINRLTAGKYLLKKLLLDAGQPENILDKHEIDPMGKPFINGVHSFNISHSGQVVICVLLNEQGNVGADVERIRDIEIEKFSKQFSPPEMMQILGSPHPTEKFFDFWTMKEAVMKADGRGMRMALHSIRLKLDHATIDDKEGVWNLYPVMLHETVRSHICSDIPLAGLELKHVHIHDLFNP